MTDLKVQPEQPIYAKSEASLGALGARVGTVDHLEGEDYLKLKRKDADDGRHHWIPVAWLDRIENNAVILNKTEDEFLQNRLAEPPQDPASHFHRKVV